VISLRTLIPAALLALLFLPFTFLPGQEQQGVSIKVESAMVLVDLVVAGRQGRFVADLKPEEVEVYQDNKKKNILFLELKQSGLHHPQLQQPPAPATPPAPASAGIGATQPGSRASLVIMIDLQSMLLSDLVLAKRAIADFVKSKLAPEDLLMLVVLGNSLEVRQPVTATSVAMHPQEAVVKNAAL
jgi:VWFA-related protein